jgi:putative transposase
MRANNRAENSHLPIRRRKQQKFQSQGSAQRYLSTHGPIYNLFNTSPHLISRPGLRTSGAAAQAEWAIVTQAA